MVSSYGATVEAAFMKSLLVTLAVIVLGTQAQVPASIEGIVVRAGTTTPVVRARVSLGGSAQIITDESGKFAFRNLQSGRYRIFVNHNSYLPAQYGERSRGGAGADVT